MRKIALVTDSTADLTQEIKRKYDIHLVSLNVRFDDREYKGDELISEEFYRLLKESKELPTTSQPSPGQFASLYNRLIEDYDDIISIHLSSGLSGTLNAANLARNALETQKQKNRIHIIDSKNVSAGLGLLVIEAAKSIRKGLTVNQVIDKILDARDNIEMLFVLDTLKYLEKGGRLGRIQSLMGTLLNIKPIIRVEEDGILDTYGKVRGRKKAIEGLVEGFKDLSRGRKYANLAVVHSDAEQAGLYLKEILEDTFELKTSLFNQVGPIIGTYAGPGGVGAAILFEK